MCEWVLLPVIIQLEEEQRAGVRERKANGEEWKQKYFHLEGDNWVYNTPLAQRFSQ